jgi:HSP20 family protein
MVKNLIPWKKKKHEVEVLAPDDDPTFALTRGMSDMVHQLFRQFDERFPHSLFRSHAGMSAMPSVDVVESDDAVTVTADLPGLDEKDLNVSLDDHFLTLRGERKEEREKKGKNYHQIERSYGTFHRSIALPEGIDRDNVEASFKKGVLQVKIAKKPGSPHSVRRIPVKAE